MSRPRIGLNCDVAESDGAPDTLKLGWRYAEGVVQAGGVPVLLPPVSDDGLVDELLDGLDGLVLVGGRDYDPALYGQAAHAATRMLAPRRMAFDVALARAARARGLATLGICGGVQLINIVHGGGLVQDIASTVPDALTHTREGSEEQFHGVEVASGSLLAEAVGGGELEVNSSHHQAVGTVGCGLCVVACAPDGVVEAVEGTGETFVLGVQWHPERLLERGEQAAVFGALVRASA